MNQRKFAIASSFAGAFLGWTVAYVAHIFYQVFISRIGYLTDVSFWRGWTAIVVATWWLIIVIPLVMFRGVRARLASLSFAISRGIGAGLVGYLVIIAWLAGVHWYTLSFAGSVGAITGGVVWWVMRWRWTRCAAPPSWLARAIVSALPVAMAFWLFGAWPVICLEYPRIQYRFGGPGSRNEAILRVLSRVKVGDPYDKLSDMLPEQFMRVKPSGHAGSTSSFGSIDYKITVKNGIVTELDYPYDPVE